MDKQMKIEDYIAQLKSITKEDDIPLKELKEKMANIYREAIAFAEKTENVDQGKLAEVYSGYAKLLQDNYGDMSLEEKYYRETLNILQNLREGGNKKYLKEEAEVSRRLAIMKRVVDEAEAIQLYQGTLCIYRTLAKSNPKEYLRDVATTLNDTAILHSNTGQENEAEAEWNEALEILQEYSSGNHLLTMFQIATVHTNLADLYRHQKRYEESDVESEEALWMFRFLAKKQPNKYRSDVACYGLINRALLHEELKQYDKELDELKEGLTILLPLYAEAKRDYVYVVKNRYIELFKKVLDVISTKEQIDKVCDIFDLLIKTSKETPCFSMIEIYDFYHAYGYVLQQNKRNDIAEEMYLNAIEWSKQLSAINGGREMPETAMTLNNLALLHRNMKRYEDSEQEYYESLKIFRTLAKVISETHLEDVVRVLGNLANLHKRMGKKEEAEKEKEEKEEIKKYLKEHDNE